MYTHTYTKTHTQSGNAERAAPSAPASWHTVLQRDNNNRSNAIYIYIYIYIHTHITTQYTISFVLVVVFADGLLLPHDKHPCAYRSDHQAATARMRLAEQAIVRVPTPCRSTSPFSDLGGATCLIRPHLSYACCVVSRITTSCYMIHHF